MTTFYLAPGVYPEELDLSNRAVAISTSIGAAVITSKKGPVGPRFITDKLRFIELYGQPDASWGFGHHSLIAFLETSNALWVNRVVKGPGIGGAKYAGAIVHNDIFGSNASQTFNWPFPTGRFGDYSSGTQQVITLNFSADLVAANSVIVTLSDGTSDITSTVVYTDNSDNTLALLALDLQTKMNNTWATDTTLVSGAVKVITGGSTNSDDRIIRILVPEGQQLSVTTSSVTLGTSQASITVVDNPVLFEIYAAGPGQDGSNIGYKIVNINQGTNQRQKITFSSAITTGQTFNMAISIEGNTFTVDPVPYTTSNDATFSLIKTAILNAFNNNGYTDKADVYVVDNGANDREIVIVSPIDGASSFEIIDPKVSGTGTLASVTVTEILAGIDKDDTFELWVFTRDNIYTPVEKHLVSFTEQIDGYGRQLYIEDVINTSESKSDYIRVVYNTYNGAGNIVGLSGLAASTNITWLSGGDSGSMPSSAEISAAWDIFNDRRVHAIRILINCGYSSAVVQNKLISIAEKRKDCFAILDMPSRYQTTAEALDYRLGNTGEGFNPNTSYAAIYTPDLQIVDEFTNRNMFVPPSGYVAAQFAENDAVAAEWFAPAWINRGLIKNIVGLRVDYRDGDSEQLFPNQINAIIKKPGKGYPIGSAETLQSKASVLSNINVRRLLITIQVSLTDALDYTLYEPNDPITQLTVKQLCINFLQPIQDNRGLYGYDVLSDDKNNKPYHKDMGLLNVDVILRPVIPVKFIRLRSVITKTGTSFEEVIGLLNSSSSVSS